MMETNNSLASRLDRPYDLEADGIYYKHLRGTDEITVTSSANNRYEYFGDFIIPRKVTYRERNYRVTGIGEHAFSYSPIFSIEIPETISDIGEDAFHLCSELASITIPSSVKSIGDRAFWGCRFLKTIVLPESVTNIGKALFFNCSRLESIAVAAGNSSYTDIDGVLFTKDKTMLIAYPPAGKGSYSIPEGVTAIANHAFKTCLKLTTITLPASVLSIGRSAFNECRSLTEIRVDALVPPACAKDAFNDIPKECKLIVPEGSKDAYQKADEWKKFSF